MSKLDKERAEKFMDRLNVIVDSLELLADEVERWVMKKTTQRSPEFRGGANC